MKLFQRRPRESYPYIVVLIFLISCVVPTVLIFRSNIFWCCFRHNLVIVMLSFMLLLTVFIVSLALIYYWNRLAQLARPITSNHGNSLVEVIQNLRHEQFEYTAVFDLDGQKLDESTILCRTEVKWSETKKQRILAYPDRSICLHNHPHADTAFSVADVTNFMRYPSAYSLVVTPNFLYSLRPAADVPMGSDEETLRRIRDTCEAIEKQAYNNWRCNHSLLDYIFIPQAQLSVEISRETCRLFAAQYHLIFEIYPLH